MENRWLRFYYTYVEVGLEFVTGLSALAAPQLFLQTLAPAYVSPGGPAAAAAELMTREFGMMNIAFGLVHFTMIYPWEQARARRLLAAMIPGDVIHLVIALTFIAQNGALTAANAFNLALSVVSPPLRAWFVLRRLRET